MALWQALIPKINKDDGSDPKSHLLDNWNNISSFDDYDNLLKNMDSIFPSPPPMPPSRPVPVNMGSIYGDVSGINGNFLDGVTGDYGISDDQGGTRNPQDIGSAAAGGGGSGSGNDGEGVTIETGKTSSHGDDPKTSAIPISMVVAIGGSLLLINILIFAGLCYQRERIRKMRIIKTSDGPDLAFVEDQRFQRKGDREQDYTHTSLVGTTAAPECMSLMSSGSSHQNCQSPRKNSNNGLTHIHCPSPQPSTHSRRGLSQPRSTPPIDSVNYTYSALPTNVTSPVHTASSRSGSTGGTGNNICGGNPGGVASSSSGVGAGSSGGGCTTSALMNNPALFDSGTYVNSKVRAPSGGCNNGGGSGVISEGYQKGHQTPRPMVSSSQSPLSLSSSGITPPITTGETTFPVNANGGDRVVGGGRKSAFVSPSLGSYNRKPGIGSGTGKSGGPTTGVSGLNIGAGTGSRPGSSSTGVGLSTFGPGYSGTGNVRDSNPSPNRTPPLNTNTIGPHGNSNVDTGRSSNSGGSGSGGSGGGSSSDPVYKTINKSGQNNAVTIV